MDGVHALPDPDAAAGANRDDLQVLAYNLQRVIKVLGAATLIEAMRA